MPTDAIALELKPSELLCESCGPCKPPEVGYSTIKLPNIVEIAKSKDPVEWKLNWKDRC